MAEEKDPYLAKWLIDKLSPKDLEKFEKSEEYTDFEKIVKGMEYFYAPDFDEDRSLETTLAKLEQQKNSKVINIRPFLYIISAAASITLLIGLFFNKISYTATPGSQLSVVLPDGSTVELNAGSSLSHQRFFWSNDRNVSLDGEAFFKVTSGNTFTVTSALGDVKVLGTQFNVKGRAKTFEVTCYEGKVKVSSQDQQNILKAGDAIILKNNHLVPSKTINTQPLWMQGESLFTSIPLSEVLDEIERQFDVTFIRNNINLSKLFTGGFVHGDLTIALESVLAPMGIQYQISNKTITLSP